MEPQLTKPEAPRESARGALVKCTCRGRTFMLVRGLLTGEETHLLKVNMLMMQANQEVRARIGVTQQAEKNTTGSAS